jgi:hypothetical protein
MFVLSVYNLIENDYSSKENSCDEGVNGEFELFSAAANKTHDVDVSRRHWQEHIE